MERDARIFIAGHEGMIGSAVWRRLKNDGFTGLLTPTNAELELTDQKAVAQFFRAEKPEYVFLAAGKIGGILANSHYPAEFIYANIQIQSNLIHSAWQSGVKKLLFLGSSCIYPKECPQPMKEEYLLSGKLEPTSEAYALAKIAGIKMCQAYYHQYGEKFISAVPADLYGPSDDFNPETGHVLASLIAKMHQAKIRNQPQVTVWGSGSPRRECLHVDDLADACVFLMENYDEPEMINVGSGEDLSIRELAMMIKNIVGFGGALVFDQSKPDGAPQKLLEVSRIRKLGWASRISPVDGIRQTYQWYESHIKTSIEA
jgi:GDP-L-fucose synthase